MAVRALEEAAPPRRDVLGSRDLPARSPGQGLISRKPQFGQTEEGRLRYIAAVEALVGRRERAWAISSRVTTAAPPAAHSRSSRARRGRRSRGGDLEGRGGPSFRHILPADVAHAPARSSAQADAAGGEHLRLTLLAPAWIVMRVTGTSHVGVTTTKEEGCGLQTSRASRENRADTCIWLVAGALNRTHSSSRCLAEHGSPGQSAAASESNESGSSYQSHSSEKDVPPLQKLFTPQAIGCAVAGTHAFVPVDVPFLQFRSAEVAQRRGSACPVNCWPQSSMYRRRCRCCSRTHQNSIRHHSSRCPDCRDCSARNALTAVTRRPFLAGRAAAAALTNRCSYSPWVATHSFDALQEFPTSAVAIVRAR